MGITLLLAQRLLRHQKGTFSAFIIRLAIGATALSVAVMIVAVCFIGGFKQAIREKLFSFWGEVLIVPFDANNSDITSALPVRLDAAMLSNIRKMPEVKYANPFILLPGILQSDSEMEGIRLKGITKDQVFPAGVTVTGSPINFADSSYAQQLLLSRTTAARLRVKEGDAIRLYFITDGAPRIRKLKVSGLYHTGMDEVDRHYAICDLRLLQRLSNWAPDEISGYQIELNDNNLVDSMAWQIHDRYVMPPMSAQTIIEIYPGIFSWLGTQDTNGRILLIIMGIVAIINLASAMLILMVDRSVMIGLLKALGMAPRHLWALFLSVAGLIGGLGIVIGNIIGLGLCLAQLYFPFIDLPEETYNMSTVPVRIEAWQVLLIDIGTLALCVACTALPLLYIRRVQPARVLQFQ